jgi:endonuclease YncB( thermonuclease family)
VPSTLVTLDLVGIFVFAISGALVAVRKDYDVFGVLVLAAALPAAADQVYRVVQVLDGDTIRTLEHGKIRFAITAAPETGDRARCPREAALAERAKGYVARRVVDGVMLRPEPGERDVDRYGRLLRHVYAADGGDIEAELIARGLAVRFVHGARPHDWCRP